MTLVGNHLALDLVNTKVRGPNGERELLASYGDLVAWLEEAGVISHAAAARARRWAHQTSAREALAAAIAIREAIRDAATCLARRTTPGAGTLAALNAHLGRSIATTRLALRDGVIHAERALSIEAPADLLVPLAEAGRDLLLEADRAFVRRCAAPKCIRWFYDTSRNHTREWCDMASCGNRAKAAKHRARLRSS